MGVAASTTVTVVATDAATTGPGLNRGAFVLANNLQALRSGHAATSLRSGLVIITGGTYGGSPTSFVERYNPASGEFLVIAELNSQRAGHTATLLDDGRVLVTGGRASGGAELFTYDTATQIGSSTFTGTLGQQRSGHTATLLPNGNVLIVAGTNMMSGVPTNSAEVYDPTSGTFSAASGVLSTLRSGHSATLLAVSGNIATLLVAGGDATGTAELVTYDIATNALVQIGSASWAAPRTGHTATLLLDGTVLIAGGTTAGVLVATAVFYKVPADLSVFSTFSTVASPTAMNIARSGHTATFLDNGVSKRTGWCSSPAVKPML